MTPGCGCVALENVSEIKPIGRLVKMCWQCYGLQGSMDQKHNMWKSSALSVVQIQSWFKQIRLMSKCVPLKSSFSSVTHNHLAIIWSLLGLFSLKLQMFFGINIFFALLMQHSQTCRCRKAGVPCWCYWPVGEQVEEWAVLTGNDGLSWWQISQLAMISQLFSPSAQEPACSVKTYRSV